jgi:glycosyltransferase involved in cell wall biosynthesis
LVQRIRQTLAQGSFDVVHIEHLRGAEFGSAVKGTPVVFDSVDSITLLFERVLAAGPNLSKRLLAGLDLARTRRYEGRLLERFCRVLVTSPQDKTALVRLSTTPAAANRLVVLPNGVDLDYFTPLALPRDPATLIFSGKMSYHANVAAALDLVQGVMPLIRQELPEVRLVIAGKDPTPQLLALTQDPRITVTGTVPDLRPHLAQATLALAPMRYGVGIQNKVLEAMAMATPVISTPQALSALQVQPGHEAIAADTPQNIAQAAIKLLTNEPLRQRLGHSGRRYVESCHDWQAIVKRLEGVYREAMAAHALTVVPK